MHNQFSRPFLFIILKSVETNFCYVMLVRCLKIQNRYILGQSMPFPCYVAFPSVENDALSNKSQLFCLQNSFFESVEYRCRICTFDVLPFQQDCPTFKVNFFTDHSPDIECYLQLVLISFNNRAPYFSYSVWSLLIRRFPNIYCSF